ncbi:MAG TPA: hypothetical protein VKP58_08150 [Candidatus Acidoferrum sp.]|nr:hypothetical protein [Candidatus Acidoferrum sp.]
MSWKYFLYCTLYVSVGLIVAGLLSGVVSGFLPASLGGRTAAPAA